MDNSTLLVVSIIGCVILIAIVVYSQLKHGKKGSPVKKENFKINSSYDKWMYGMPPIWVLFEETFPCNNRGVSSNSVNLWGFDDLYAYQKICLSSIYKYHSHNPIHFLTYTNIEDYLPNFNVERFSGFSSEVQRELIKYCVLSQYGGIWLTSWTLVFTDLNVEMKRLQRGNCLAVGNQIIRNDKWINAPDMSCLLSHPGNELMSHMATTYYRKATSGTFTDTFDPNTSELAMEQYKKKTLANNKTSSFIHLNGEYNGTIGKYGGEFSTRDVFATDVEIAWKTPKKVLWYQLDYEEVLRNLKMKWFLYMETDPLLNSHMLLSRLSRVSLGVSGWEDKEYKITTNPVLEGPLRKIWETENKIQLNRLSDTYQGVISPFSLGNEMVSNI